MGQLDAYIQCSQRSEYLSPCIAFGGQQEMRPALADAAENSPRTPPHSRHATRRRIIAPFH